MLLAHLLLIAVFLSRPAPRPPSSKAETLIALRVLPPAGPPAKPSGAPAAAQPPEKNVAPAARTATTASSTTPSISPKHNTPTISLPHSEAVGSELSKHDAKPVSAQLSSQPDFKAAYLNNPKPPYPRLAIRQQIEGTVILVVRVLPDGRPGEVRIDQSSGNSLLDDSAVKTVKSWRFVPARQGGVAVSAEVRVPIVFSLK